jgi:hypothetical protein
MGERNLGEEKYMEIIRTKDYLVRNRARTVRERIKLLCGQMYRKGMLDMPFQDTAAVGAPVIAEINHGQWVAFCGCGGAESVDWDEPIFYCFHCGNRSTHGKPRPVVFPEPALRAKIEALLLDRPVDDAMGTNAIDQAFMAKPLAVGVVGDKLVALERSWKPGESIEELLEQNLLIDELVAQALAAKNGDVI